MICVFLSQRILRLYQAAHDIDPIPVAVANLDPGNRDPEELWQQLWEAGHVSRREPIDLATFMAYPEGTKRCGKSNSGMCQIEFAAVETSSQALFLSKNVGVLDKTAL